MPPITPITVTTDPVSVTAAAALEVSEILGSFRAQNIDPTEMVFRAQSALKPSRSAPAFRHPPGDRWSMNLAGEPTWLWVESGTAQVVLEEGAEW